MKLKKYMEFINEELREEFIIENISTDVSIEEIEKNGNNVGYYEIDEYDEIENAGFVEIYEYKGRRYFIVEWSPESEKGGGKEILHNLTKKI